jgi:plastocyanin
MNQATKEKEEIVITSQPAPRKGPFALLPFSTLGKIALWSTIVGALSSVGGTAVLAALKGSASTASIVVAVCWLIALVILITRFRWAPVVSTLLTGYIFIALMTESYVIASLASPKDPQIGGLIHFIGDIVTIICAILALGASIGAAIENYRHSGNRQTPRWLPSALSLVAGLTIGALFIGILAQPPVTIGASLNGVPTVHMNASAFDQSSITIAKGSSLVLVDDSTVQHLLFNGSWKNGIPEIQHPAGAPTVNAVSLSDSSVTIGPFAVAGTYYILCSVHQGMTLTIIVQ